MKLIMGFFVVKYKSLLSAHNYMSFTQYIDGLTKFFSTSNKEMLLKKIYLLFPRKDNVFLSKKCHPSSHYLL